MTFVPWKPKNTWWITLHDLERFQDDINKVFNTFSPESCKSNSLLEGKWTPAIDVYDSKDNIMVLVDIPGMNKEDIDVTIHGDTLTIKGEKKLKKDSKDDDYIRRERFYGNFNRTLSLQSSLDVNKVNAFYMNGVLKLVLSKKEEEKPKRIEVNVN